MPPADGQWRGDLKAHIYATQTTALRAVTKKPISLYRDIGRSIDERQQTEGWEKGVVGALPKDPRAKFGEKSGYSERNLWYMLTSHFCRQQVRLDGGRQRVFHRPAAVPPCSEKHHAADWHHHLRPDFPLARGVSKAAAQ